MGVRAWLARRAVRATRVLVVEGAGGFVTRVAVERAARQRGWRLADSPASADALVVAGRAGSELAEVVERLWDAMPGPRARADVGDATEVAAALHAVAARLGDRHAQAGDAAGRPAPDLSGGEADADHDGRDHEGHEDDGGMGHEGMDHEDHEGMDHGGHEGMDHEDHGGMDHEDDGGMDHGGHEGMDHGGHEAMDHGDMDMSPDGIPLAEGAEDDRDGLEMDALPVRLGPVLPHWPAGLVLDVTLHGDLVVDASARLLDDGERPSAETPGTRAARRCDELADALALTGWEQGATLARSARDDLLDRGGGDARALLVELRHRVEHSRPLRWSLGGIAVVTADRAADLGLPPEVVGDCRDRLLRLVDRATAAAQAYAGTGDVSGPAAVAEPPVVPVTAWAVLVRGLDLGVARLVVATLGRPVPSSEAVGHV